MFTHIVLGAHDLSASKAFFDAALGALGYPSGLAMPDRVVYPTEGGILVVTLPIDGNPASFGNGVTIGLKAGDPATVNRFFSEGIAAGGQDAGAPGPRAAIPNSYAAYLRDPVGNKIVAWCVGLEIGMSTDEHASVHRKNLAGNVTCAIGGEIGTGMRDVLWRAGSWDGNVLGYHLKRRECTACDGFVGHGRRHDRWRDGVNGDPLSRKFPSKRSRQSDHAALRCRVMDLVIGTRLRRMRRYGDDAPPLRRDHVRDRA